MSWGHLLRHGDDGGARAAWVDARAQRGAAHRCSADAALERESDCKIIVKHLRVQVVVSRHQFGLTERWQRQAEQSACRTSGCFRSSRSLQFQAPYGFCRSVMHPASLRLTAGGALGVGDRVAAAGAVAAAIRDERPVLDTRQALRGARAHREGRLAAGPAC